MPVLRAKLAPFDLRSGLLAINGKDDLLRKLIVDFGKHYAGSQQELDALIIEGRPGDARRLAHHIEGVAASLGIASQTVLIKDHLTKGHAPCPRPCL